MSRFIGYEPVFNDGKSFSYLGTLQIANSGTNSDISLDVTSLGLEKDDYLLVGIGVGANTTSLPNIRASGFTHLANADYDKFGQLHDVKIWCGSKLVGDTVDTTVTFLGGTNSANASGVFSVSAFRSVNTSNPLANNTVYSNITTNSCRPDPPVITPSGVTSAFLWTFGAGGRTYSANASLTDSGNYDYIVSSIASGSQRTAIGATAVKAGITSVYNPPRYTLTGTGVNDSTNFSSIAFSCLIGSDGIPVSLGGVWNYDVVYKSRSL